MKILIAPDKFKGSLTAQQVCAAVKAGVLSAIPDSELMLLPMADGGDGVLDVLMEYGEGEQLVEQVNNPLFRIINAEYGFASSSKIAYIEMARASGLTLLNECQYTATNSTSYGTGELILSAVNKGAQKIVLGVGGSATNDAGIGMAAALGYKFRDHSGQILRPIGANLRHVVEIDDSELTFNPNEIDISVACDVTNPFAGGSGAAYVYGPQKGATAEDIIELDAGLHHLAGLIQDKYKLDISTLPGAGAAGGLAGGAVAFLGAKLVSGIELIKEISELSKHIESADLVITGEGKIDQQTLSGKVVAGVIQEANKLGKPVIAVCGMLGLRPGEVEQLGLKAVASILQDGVSFESAMENAFSFLQQRSSNLVMSYIQQSKLGYNDGVGEV